MKRIAQLRTIVLLVWVLVALASSLAPMLWGTPWGELRDGLLPNLGTEMVGAALTYALFELFIGRGEKEAEKQADLIAQMGSDVRDVAVHCKGPICAGPICAGPAYSGPIWKGPTYARPT